MTKEIQSYQQQKINLLDNLQPNDFRNGAVFSQAEEIIDSLNKRFLEISLQNGNAEEFICKSVANLFREGSSAANEVVLLAKAYLKNSFKY